MRAGVRDPWCEFITHGSEKCKQLAQEASPAAARRRVIVVVVVVELRLFIVFPCHATRVRCFVWRLAQNYPLMSPRRGEESQEIVRVAKHLMISSPATKTRSTQRQRSEPVAGTNPAVVAAFARALTTFSQARVEKRHQSSTDALPPTVAATAPADAAPTAGPPAPLDEKIMEKMLEVVRIIHERSGQTAEAIAAMLSLDAAAVRFEHANSPRADRN